MPSHDARPDPPSGPAAPTDEAMPGEVCTTSEAARLLGVSNTTVQTMVERGELRAWKTLGGHRRISMAAIERLRRERMGGERRGADALTVLVVERDEALRAAHATRMSSWGLPLRVLSAADGLDALLMIERTRPDALVWRLATAPMDGIELLRRLRERHEYDAMSIVAVSAMSADEVDRRGGLTRGVALFGEPLSFERLRGFLQALALRQQMALR